MADVQTPTEASLLSTSNSTAEFNGSEQKEASTQVSMTETPARKVEYGVTPTDVMASMKGIDFLRAMFEGKFPAPPIMQNIEPFDYVAELVKSRTR